MVVALVGRLLSRRKARFDAGAQRDECVAVVGLLHRARDDIADTVGVLLVDLLALSVPDDLQDDPLGRLRGVAGDVGILFGIAGDEEALEYEDAARFPVDGDPHVVLGLEPQFVAGGQRLLKAVHDHEPVDALLTLEHLERGC